MGAIVQEDKIFSISSSLKLEMPMARSLANRMKQSSSLEVSMCMTEMAMKSLHTRRAWAGMEVQGGFDARE